MNQAPVFTLVFVLGVVVIFFLATRKSFSRQRRVDQFLDYLAEKAPREELKDHLKFFKFMKGDQLDLSGKFGTGVASQRYVARLLARALKEKLLTPENLVEGVVSHFTEEKRWFLGSWFWRTRRAEEFVDLVVSELPDKSLVHLRHKLEAEVEFQIHQAEQNRLQVQVMAKEKKAGQKFELDFQLAREIFRGEGQSVTPANPAAADSTSVSLTP